MDEHTVRRVRRPLTESDRERLAQARAQIAAELPELNARNHLRREAAEEQTLSGELRRMLHHSPRPLAIIAQEAGLSPIVLDEFLTGERTLRSDVMDRLAAAVGYTPSPPAA